MSLESLTHPADPQMDNAFTACFEQNPEPLFERFGPSIMETPNGNVVAFGQPGEHAPAPAYAAAIAGGLAVGCAARADFQPLFTSLAARGVVGLSLQTLTMHDALHHVSAGHGQVASLAIAANLADRGAQPPLAPALVDLRHKNLSGLHYTEPQAVVRAARQALSGYARERFGEPVANNPHALLARSYFELISQADSLRPTDKVAWYDGVVRACNALRQEGLNVEEMVGHEVHKLFEAILRLGSLEIKQGVNSKFVALELPRRPGGHTPESTPRLPSPGLALVRWRREVAGSLTAFRQCVDDAAFTWEAVRRLQRENPTLSPKEIQSALAKDKYYALMVTEKGQHAHVWIRHGVAKHPSEVAVLLAAAHALGVGDRPTERVRAAAEQYLLEHLPQLTRRGLDDLPEVREGLVGLHGVISAEEFRRFTSGLTRLERPPKHVVQLATQVLLHNAASALPLGQPPRKPAAETHESTGAHRQLGLKARLPGETGYRPGKAAKEREAWEQWQQGCGAFDTVTGSLKEFLGSAYNCPLDIQPGLNHRLATGRLNSEDALFCFLAYHAKLEATPEGARSALVANIPPGLTDALGKLDPASLPTPELRALHENLKRQHPQRPRLLRGL